MERRRERGREERQRGEREKREKEREEREEREKGDAKCQSSIIASSFCFVSKMVGKQI